MSELYYCSTPVPETDSEVEHVEAVAFAKDHAVRQVKYIVGEAGEDFERGLLMVTESMDSNLEREYVIAEWVRR